MEGSKAKDIYLYFNNTWGTSALNNAFYIQKELAGLHQVPEAKKLKSKKT
jgi:uncharacterized protein YecE (DUF72 family)